MGYTSLYNNAINANNPMGKRYLAFMHCLEKYSFLANESFRNNYLLLNELFQISPSSEPARLTDALKLLTKCRELILKERNVYVQLRKSQKATGVRQPRKIDRDNYHEKIKGVVKSKVELQRLL